MPGRTTKEYYEDNKEKRLEYYHDNKEKTNEYRNQKVTCECGCEVNQSSLTRHRKSKFHQELMESLSSANVM